MLISAIKLIVPIGIMLICNTVAPLTTNALQLSDGDGDDIFLPVPRPTSYDSMNTSIPNRVQVSQRSNLIFTSIPHQLLTPSHPNMNTSIPSPNSIQFLPGSDRVSNGSNSYYYNNFDSWTNRTPYGLWKPLLAISHFLNIPKNLIVPPACLLNVCPTIVGTQRGDIIIATDVNNARILGLGGNDIIECGIGNCNVFSGFGNNVLMSGSSTSAHLFAGSGGYSRPGNNIFIGGGGVTLMVGGNGNDQFYAGSNRLFSGGNDIMIGGSGANYFDCGPNGNGVILDFNPAKGDTKAPNCKYVITMYSNNIFGPGIPNVFPGPGLFPGQNLNLNGVNNTAVVNAGNGTSVVTTHNRVPS
jgi:Ca2+-binding RTX toxin-like protein